MCVCVCVCIHTLMYAYIYLSIYLYTNFPYPFIHQRTFRLFPYLSSEKAMVAHSSTLAWKIPWTAEPGRLQSMGL